MYKNLQINSHWILNLIAKDYRIIVFGGIGISGIPVKAYYVVLDTRTFEWYHGIEDVSQRAPFAGHTASIYNDYMFIAFGECCPLKIIRSGNIYYISFNN